MRESFVFHIEYIADVPEECKEKFAAYIMNYGFYGKVPDVTGFELTFWKSVQRRIDTDSINYQISVYNNRIGAINQRIRNNKATEKDKANLLDYQKIVSVLNEKLNNISYISYDTYNTSTHDIDIDIDSDIDNVSDSDIDIDSDIESDNEFECVPDNGSVIREARTQNAPKKSIYQEKYAKQVFEKFKNAGLPCQNGDFFKFECADFRLALEKIKGIHSEEVLKAIDNYIFELKNPESYVSKELSFNALVNSKLFTDFMPANYRPKNYKKYHKEIPKGKAPESPPQHYFETCPSCGQTLMEWNNEKQLYVCSSCNHSLTFEEWNNGRAS